MKKTLTILLALVFAVSLFASFALVADASGKTDSFKLMSIKVTDALGYANPYSAADNAAAFVENQAAYIVLEMKGMDADNDDYYAPNAQYDIAVTSSTIDLSYALSTMKMQTIAGNGTILPGTGTYAAPFVPASFDSSKATLNLNMDGVTRDSAGDTRFFYSFIGVTKAATAGEVKASMKVSPIEFATATGWQGSNEVLVAYDSTGNPKYTIVKVADPSHTTTYRVFSGKAVSTAYVSDAAKYLFDYVQTGSTFEYIGYSATPSNLSAAGAAIGFTYDGKLIYPGADNTLGTADDLNLTTAVNAANTFFGFTFSTNNAAYDSAFEAKTAGNPIVVSDAYAYVTASVPTTDDDVVIVPTGDFSANIVVLLIGSAVLAAAAFLFIAKKVRD